jgi:hypothetical protein
LLLLDWIGEWRVGEERIRKRCGTRRGGRREKKDLGKREKKIGQERRERERGESWGREHGEEGENFRDGRTRVGDEWM